MAKRRANGEGSIFQRKDGLWAAEYTDNADKRRYLYGKTQQIVKDKLKEAQRQSDDGLSMDKSKVLFKDWLWEWLEVYVKPMRRGKTYSLYYGCIHDHIAPAFPKVALKDLRPNMLQRFINEKAVGGRADGKPGGLSVSALKNIKKTMLVALNQAMDNDIITKNVVAKVKIPAEAHKDIEVLILEEQSKLEAAIAKDSNPLTFAIMLDLYTGLRVGELVGLKLGDIDLGKRELTVRRAISRYCIPGEGRTVVKEHEPKTAKGQRIIPLPEFIVESLRVHIQERNETVKQIAGRWRGFDAEAAKKWKDEGYLFISACGKPPDSRHMWHLLEKLLGEVGVKRIKFHALRHTFATRAIEVGFDVKSLSEILGHADATMTLNTYTHALEEQKRRSMDKLTMVSARGASTQNARTGEIQ